MKAFGQIVNQLLLPRLEKPSRYLGCELHSAHKDPAEVDVRVCLAYPELYELALGNLGVQVLYQILNALPGVWAERAYAPPADLEAELRAHGWPLFSVESKTPLRNFDILGFTLQYELNYTNLLNMLELGGIPLLAAERGDNDPLVVGGGPCTFSPEPLVQFMDAFAVGEGEDAVIELAQAVRETRGLPRGQRLRRFAEIPGVYVPSLYETVALPDGTVVLADEGVRVQRRLVTDLGGAPFPTNYLVPFTEQVHDRVSLEVLRGCTRGCRFCLAGMTTRPVRERSVDQLACLAERTFAATGYEEIALSSLSTCDYRQVDRLVAQQVEIAREWGAAVALPSLRLDSFSVELADRLQSIRKTGLTFAPEAATDRMRAVINKFISEDELTETATKVYASGWDLLKLYFMIGLPSEREEDVAAIAKLARKVLEAGRRVNRRAKLNLAISTFVPKPHTPFQWEQQLDVTGTQERQRLLREGLGRSGMKYGWHDARMSFLEGVFCRGDRRVGELLLHAYRLGCRFDGWTDHLSFDKWQQAFDQWGHDPKEVLRERDPSMRLPWDHIDPMVTKAWLLQERERAYRGQHSDDCRSGRCNQCGLMKHAEALCLDLLRQPARVQPVESAEARRTEAAPAVQRLRIGFAKRGDLRFLSHREVVNALLRALRRARLPLAYSGGFHPQPRVSFATALPTGTVSEAELADVNLSEAVEPVDFLQRMNAALPPGLTVLEATETELRGPSLGSLVCGARYVVELPGLSASDLRGPAEALLARESLLVQRKSNAGTKEVNVRPFVHQLHIHPAPEGALVEMELSDGEGGKGRPLEVVAALVGSADPAEVVGATVTKTATMLRPHRVV